MPADEVTHGADAEASRVRTGPRHAAPRKPLFTRFHVPAGKAIALAAMPTAVLMGMGLTPTLAAADGNDPATASKSLTAEEYKACVEALADKDSASPSPSESESESGDDAAEESASPEPSPSATTPSASPSVPSSSSPDSGSDDGDGDGDGAAEEGATGSKSDADDDPAEAGAGPSAPASVSPSPSASASGGGLLQGIGDALEDLFTGGKGGEEPASPSATPSASASGSASESASGTEDGEDAPGEASEAVQEATEAAGGAAEAGGAGGTVETGGTGGEATASPGPGASAGADPGASASPSPSESGAAEDCPIATDAEGGVDNNLALPNRPWELEASSLRLKGASYKGVVEVRTADGTTKKVLKYVISNGTDIGDLHQIVHDDATGKTYHVQAAEGSTSTITDGDTVMYTESISGNLLGLVPITFDPEHPPPLDIPLIYFTNVKVVQAGQFGGTLTVPGLHQYITD
ncbi:hypothetical protein [Streptomyces griseoviridis]|uniref:hypothetical protein n=1 Tax=Streptomyces griseoviridis TaxID=45398 RepID=UPI00167AA3A0|nr:hypothetical protein [Streptomyces griseoviridis]GGS83887.1 hypothetical protein GCM10010240_16530 [Streptomyces griseoviridis]